MIRLAILGSTRGTNLTALVKAIEQKELAAEIAIVLSNKADAMILERAVSYGLSAEFVDPQGLTREEYDSKISAILQTKKIDLIVLLGYMRILSDEFVATWRNKMINVHPSLLPDFAGGMDIAVHRAVLAAGMQESGCTVHYVTEEVDAGPMLVQKKCPVLADDTPETLKARVQALEGVALVEAISGLAERHASEV